MKNLILFGMCTICCSLVHAQNTQSQNMQSMGMGDCSSYSMMEQDFAAELSDANREMFCTRFNQSQRNSAMQMTRQPDMQGNLLTPDQAVEKVAKDNRIMPMQQKSRGCPMQ
jgi:hypothetical protein